jgi:hypothetical protein
MSHLFFSWLPSSLLWAKAKNNGRPAASGNKKNWGVQLVDYSLASGGFTTAPNEQQTSQKSIYIMAKESIYYSWSAAKKVIYPE